MRPRAGSPLSCPHSRARSFAGTIAPRPDHEAPPLSHARAFHTSVPASAPLIMLMRMRQGERTAYRLLVGELEYAASWCAVCSSIAHKAAAVELAVVWGLAAAVRGAMRSEKLRGSLALGASWLVCDDRPEAFLSRRSLIPHPAAQGCIRGAHVRTHRLFLQWTYALTNGDELNDGCAQLYILSDAGSHTDCHRRIFLTRGFSDSVLSKR